MKHRISISHILQHIIQMEGRQMAAIDNLKQAVSDLTVAVGKATAEIADLKTQVTNGQPNQDPSIQEQADAIMAQIAALNAGL